MHIFQVLNLSLPQWLWIIAAAFLVGFSKTGLSGAIMPVVPIIAGVFGVKAANGIALPMLLLGDLMALMYFKRQGKWKDIKKLLPWVFIGLASGIAAGNYISDAQFKAFLALLVFICLGILIYTEWKGDNLNVPKGTWFYALTGIASGFASMIGNAAMPLFSIYLLAKGFKKNNFMGTVTWFFFIINLTKVPLQIFFWHNVTLKAVLLSGVMIPVITIGALFGIWIIKRLNERVFRYLIIVMTALAAIRLLV